MASPGTVYSGSLRPKKKAELMAIARDLRIDLNEGTKVEFEAAIRSALRQSKAFQTDARFSDLWKSIVEGEQRRRAKSEARSEAEQTDDEAIAPSPARSVRSARRAIEAAPAVANEVAQRTTRSLQAVKEQTVALQRKASENHLVVATQQAADEYSNALVKFTEGQVVPLFKEVQNSLSNSWIIIGLTLALELLFILSVTVPYTREVQLKPWKWATFQLTPDHPWTVTLPDLAVIAQLSFARIFLVWVSSSVVLPLLAATLVVFPRSPGQHVVEPSALTFSLIRLATDVYLNRIAPAPVFGDWSVSVLSRFGDIQLLLAALATAFATYEVVA